jgi:hypothetical protein
MVSRACAAANCRPHTTGLIGAGRAACHGTLRPDTDHGVRHRRCARRPLPALREWWGADFFCHALASQRSPFFLRGTKGGDLSRIYTAPYPHLLMLGWYWTASRELLWGKVDNASTEARRRYATACHGHGERRPRSVAYVRRAMSPMRLTLRPKALRRASVVAPSGKPSVSDSPTQTG